MPDVENPTPPPTTALSTTALSTTASSITVLGGSGYTGTALVAAAAARGHRVTAVSRTRPADLPAGVTHVTGSVLEETTLRRAVDGADVVLSALSPRGELLDRLADVDARVAALTASAGVRLGVVGGFSSLRPAPGAPRIAEGDGLPPEFAGEARQMLAVLVALEGTDADWFVAAPSMGYGAHSDAPTVGVWRTGGDVADFDPARAALSAADFAGAVVAELETPTAHRAVVSVTGRG